MSGINTAQVWVPDHHNDNAVSYSPTDNRLFAQLCENLDSWKSENLDFGKEDTPSIQPTQPALEAATDGCGGGGGDGDEPDGCITVPVLRIVKGALSHILGHIIDSDLKESCYGCAIDHPSQRQHSCLYPPDIYYFEANFDKLVKRLFKPWLKYALAKALTVFGVKPPHLSKLQGAAEAIVCSFKEEPFIRETLQELRNTVTDQPSEKACFDAVSFWNEHSFLDEPAATSCGSVCVLANAL